MEVRDENRLRVLQKQLTNVKLLIIDELGYVPFTAVGAELLFEVFSRCYEHVTTLVTSNLPFDEWTSVLGSDPNGTKLRVFSMEIMLVKNTEDGTISHEKHHTFIPRFSPTNAS